VQLLLFPCRGKSRGPRQRSSFGRKNNAADIRISLRIPPPIFRQTIQPDRATRRILRPRPNRRSFRSRHALVFAVGFLLASLSTLADVDAALEIRAIFN